MLSEKFVLNEYGGLINETMNEIYLSANSKKDTNKRNGELGGRPLRQEAGTIRFYLLECFSEDERFYKPGITQEQIRRRYSTSTGGNKAMPYKFTVIYDMVIPFNSAISLERKISENFEKHIPKTKFGGHIESYKISDVLLKFIIDFVDSKSIALNNENPDNNETITDRKATPLTINQQPIGESTIPVGGNAHDLQNSNLFRKPIIPTKHQVWEVFSKSSGTKEMAKAFYEKYESTGWFIHGSPVVNYVALAHKFITAWHSVGNQKKDEKNHEPKLKILEDNGIH